MTIKCPNGHKVKHKDFANTAYCSQCRRLRTRERRARMRQEDEMRLGYVRLRRDR